MALQLVWFKRDLRLHDHRPLVEATRLGPVLGLYVFEPALLHAPESHRRHWAFILESLDELRRELRARGSDLWIRRGDAVSALDELVDVVPVRGLWSHEETGLEVTFARDRRVKAWSRTRGIPWTEVPQFGVVRGLGDRDGWSRRWSERMDASPLPAPQRFPPLPEDILETEPGELPTLRSLGFESAPVAQQAGGEAEGLKTIRSFLAGRGVGYRADMSSPVSAWNGCSRVSPHLAYGTLSLRRVHHETVAARRQRRGEPAVDGRWLPSLDSFAKRLRWHCHFIQKLESEPEIEFYSMNRAYEGLRTADPGCWSAQEEERFHAWREGRTGYPMVDACMRALDATGWINFRMRAMLVSFAAYHLWLDWRPVARELARRFLDFEPGIHISQCQMQSGVTGINQLRIYSPAKQAKDQDPEGRFIREWVPELAGVPTDYLASPELMSAELQHRSGCVLGRDYPHPVVEHRAAVRAARERIGRVRRSPEARRLAQEVYARHGSRRRPRPGATNRRSSDQLGLGL